MINIIVYIFFLIFSYYFLEKYDSSYKLSNHFSVFIVPYFLFFCYFIVIKKQSIIYIYKKYIYNINIIGSLILPASSIIAIIIGYFFLNFFNSIFSF